ncbi:MAG: TIGR01212 family radical SAM protein [bacterium]|nr:TIGR01212 family radical SAM protein [bacterium]
MATNTKRLWGEKPYYSLDYYLKETFGEKIYKLALESGCTCPNRDGTLGNRGCIFCSEGGSGEFAIQRMASVTEQIELAKERVARKIHSGRYIAYFQSYTNTYAPSEQLRPLFEAALSHPDIAVLSVGTRPDCLPKEILKLLSDCQRKKPVWVELGLQSIHAKTAQFIRRGYDLAVFEEAVRNLQALSIPVVVHVILGLPTESRQQMLESIHYLASLGIDGIKLQLLHILKGTDLASLYEASPFPLFCLDEYADLIADCIEALPPEVVIHRISGDAPKSLLIAPTWSANKRLVLNTIAKRLKERDSWQGKCYQSE